jgi:hypothetical protein
VSAGSGCVAHDSDPRRPLLLPVLAGYRVIDAYPVGDTLDLSMVTVGARRDKFGAYEHIAISVTVGPLTDPYLSAMLTRCQRASGGPP